MRIHRCTLEVRGYELDSYKHVNHSVYVNYFEHARWKMLEEAGIGFEQLDRWQRWPVIGRLEVDYLKPTHMGDILEVRSRVCEHRRVSFTVDHEIYRGDLKVAAGRAHIVIINENGRPAELPREFHALWDSEQEGSAD